MKIENISIVNNNGSIYKKYKVSYKNKEDIICYSNDWISFEPYHGNFNEEEFEFIKKYLFDDAYYNLNFSKY
jgi:hypothetical protein